jgi:hypothetical protein
MSGPKQVKPLRKITSIAGRSQLLLTGWCFSPNFHAGDIIYGLPYPVCPKFAPYETCITIDAGNVPVNG